MNTLKQVLVQLAEETCYKCTTHFAMDARLREQCLRDNTRNMTQAQSCQTFHLLIKRFRNVGDKPGLSYHKNAIAKVNF